MDDFDIKKIDFRTKKKGHMIRKNRIRIGKMPRIILAVLLVSILFGFFGVFLPMRKTYAIAQQAMVIGRQAADAAKAQNLPETGAQLKELDSKLIELKNSYRKTAYLKIIPIARGYYLD